MDECKIRRWFRQSDDRLGRRPAPGPVAFSEMLPRPRAVCCSADLAASSARAQTSGSAAPAVQSQKFTDWGWPLPYEQISPKSKQWLQSKGWWPLNAAWIVVWSSQEMIGHILQTLKLLEKRGIEVGLEDLRRCGFFQRGIHSRAYSDREYGRARGACAAHQQGADACARSPFARVNARRNGSIGFATEEPVRS